jgi:hypothetical protein
MVNRKLLIFARGLAVGCLTVLGLIVSSLSPIIAQEVTATFEPFSTPDTPLYMPNYQPNVPPVTDMVFERVPGPDTPTLQELALGAATDEAIVQNVVAYYEEHHDELQSMWREENESRLQAFYAMYIVHISHVYGETRYPETLVDYMTLERSHCGIYVIAQEDIVEAFGLTWRLVGLTSGWHGWIEVLVDGQWEVFDSTVNIWINRAGYELINGVTREYRYFYTPLLDIDRPDARFHLDEGYNMHNLRNWMPGLGLFYNPPGDLVLLDSSEGQDSA